MLVECPEAADAYKEGEEVTLDAEQGKIVVGNKDFSFPKLPPEILAIRNAGGLLQYTRKKLERT